MREDLCRGEILEVPVVSDNIDWGAGTLEIVPPSFEGFVYRNLYCEHHSCVPRPERCGNGRQLGATCWRGL